MTTHDIILDMVGGMRKQAADIDFGDPTTHAYALNHNGSIKKAGDDDAQARINRALWRISAGSGALAARSFATNALARIAIKDVARNVAAGPGVPVVDDLPPGAPEPFEILPLADKRYRASRVIDDMKVDGVPVREYLRSRGIALHNASSFGPGGTPAYFSKDLLKRIQNAPGNKYDFTNGLGENAKGAVVIGMKNSAKDNTIRGIASHEIGHAVRDSLGKMKPKTYGMSLAAMRVLSALGSAFNASLGTDVDDRIGLGVSAATAAAAIPVLHEELQASRLGSKLTGMRGISRLNAFRGLPSYLALASAPAVALGGRELFDRIHDKIKDRKRGLFHG